MGTFIQCISPNPSLGAVGSRPQGSAREPVPCALPLPCLWRVELHVLRCGRKPEFPKRKPRKHTTFTEVCRPRCKLFKRETMTIMSHVTIKTSLWHFDRYLSLRVCVPLIYCRMDSSSFSGFSCWEFQSAPWHLGMIEWDRQSERGPWVF